MKCCDSRPVEVTGKAELFGFAPLAMYSSDWTFVNDQPVFITSRREAHGSVVKNEAMDRDCLLTIATFLEVDYKKGIVKNKLRQHVVGPLTWLPEYNAYFQALRRPDFPDFPGAFLNKFFLNFGK